MVLATRLRRGGGSGGFTPPPPATLVTLTAAPLGGWSIPNPSAYDYNGNIYFGWTAESPGDIKVASYNHASGTTSTPFLLATNLPNDGAYDLHDNPSQLIRTDGRIVAAYCGHEDTRVRVRISTNPEDATAFDAEQVLNPGYGGVYTYAMLMQLRGIANDPIYLFARSIPNTGSQVGRLVYSKSTDGGATWAAWTVLFTGSTSPVRVPYWELASDWDTRIDIFTTAGTGAVLYHFYLDGTTDKRYTSAGVEIMTALPLTVADLTQVYDGSGASAAYYASACYDALGPAATFLKLITGDTDNAVATARWRAGAWVLNTVLATVGGHHPNNQFLPSAAMDPFDSSVVWAGKKVGSYYELYQYDSADDGATWTPAAITSGSSEDALFPEPVHFGNAIPTIWLSGTYTSDTNYSFGIKGYRP